MRRIFVWNLLVLFKEIHGFEAKLAQPHEGQSDNAKLSFQWSNVSTTS